MKNNMECFDLFSINGVFINGVFKRAGIIWDPVSNSNVGARVIIQNVELWN